MTDFNGTRILRLKLENFIGIYTGLGQTSIEIDFSKTDKRNILLLGSNGSGKSTILSTLHPFSGTFDERTDIILSGKKGRKEIDILQNGILYKIVHHYESGKNKSTIEKVTTGGKSVELNPAATTRSFVTIVEEELGLNENFFKLIKIGSQAMNFIDLKSSQRKEFIGDFTPNIEEYLNIYKVINDKLNSSNKEIKFLSNEIDKIEPLSTLTKNIKILKSTESSLQKDINKLQIKIDKSTEKIESFDVEDNKRYIDNINNLDIIKKQLNESTVLVNSFDPTSLPTSIKKNETKLASLELELNNLKISKAKFDQEYSSNNNSLTKIEKQISNYDNPNGIDESGLLSELEEHKKTYQDLLIKFGKRFKLEDIEDITDKLKTYDIDTQKDLIQELNNFSNFIFPNIMDEYNLSELHTVYLENYTDVYDNFESFLKDTLNQLEGNIDSLNLEIKNTLKEYPLEISNDVKNFFIERKECLCNNTSCSICTLAKEIISPNKSNISKGEKLLNDLKKSLMETEEDLESVKNALLFIDKVTKNVKISSGTQQVLMEVLSLPNPESSEFLDILINTSTIDELGFETVNTRLQEKIVWLEKTNRLINVINNYKKEISELELSITKYNESSKTIKLLNENKKEPVKNEIIILERSINNITSDILDLKNTIKNLYQLSDKYQEHKSLKEKFEIIMREIRDYKDQAEELEELSNLIIECKNSLTTLEQQLDNIQTQLSEVRLEESRLKDFTNRKELLEKDRGTLLLLKEALDVKTGIPLVLVGEYLNTIRNSCNNLLNIAYKGKFYIDFEISDRDFSISVFKNGTKTANDIKECSQGEISLVKTSLSLGIIAQAIKSVDKQFNIVYLDEIDAEFDSTNRLLFLDILEEQLNALNSNQCFIITHNDCFFNNEAALVLLNGANVDINDEEFMDNKDIIFKV
ncbi:MAG: double-stranded DNA repair protein Rad50 [Bacteriophage sp.]|nr:MAG: double-stranded DNA repair protein Rad50 [Bacteriophage sp.]